MKQGKKTCSGRLFALSGPSGSGKSSIVVELRRQPEIFSIVSVTSRAPRRGERDGVDYHFVSRKKFLKMVGEGEFAEYAEVAGNMYGTPRKPLERALGEGRRVLVDVDVQGAMQVKEAFGEAVLVFVRPPSMEILEERLRGRGTESEESIQRRLALAQTELECLPKYDRVVVNDELSKAIEEVKGIILGN